MDKVADMLTAIKNAEAVNQPSVSVPYSRLKLEILKIMEARGFIANVEKKNKKVDKKARIKPCLEVTLKYNGKTPAVSGAMKVSKPGQRIYLPHTRLKKVKQGHGIGIVSTSRGLMTNDEARKKKLGGEMLCEIW